MPDNHLSFTKRNLLPVTHVSGGRKRRREDLQARRGTYATRGSLISGFFRLAEVGRAKRESRAPFRVTGTVEESTKERGGVCEVSSRRWRDIVFLVNLSREPESWGPEEDRDRISITQFSLSVPQNS